jgi:recombinational DNA repair protein (RecF pathway)
LEITEGFVLGGLRYGDTSKIVKIFTRDEGKLSFMAKGAVRKNNKYGAAIDPLSRGEYKFIRKNSGLHLLTGSDLKKYYSKIISDGELLPLGLAALETVNRTQADRDPHPEVFALMQSYFDALSNSPTSSGFKLLLHFLFDYTEQMGYRIDISNYNPATPFNFLTFEDGCISHGGFAGKRFFKFETPLIEKLLHIDKELLFSGDEITSLRQFFEQYLSFHFEQNVKLNSLEYLI